MQPKRGDTTVSIPVTFDVQGARDDLTIPKMLLGLLITIGGFVAMIILFIVAADNYKPLVPLLAGFGTFIFVRFFFLKEGYYKKKQNELIENDYKFKTNLFWGIYSINDYFPYICKMANGNLCIFVAFDKDVVIGRDKDGDFDHYDALADAYALMISKDIRCIHIDYADTVGKDKRMDCFFENLTNTENTDLRQELTHMFDYIQSCMYTSYADYDVYAFYYRGREEAFWDDLQLVIEAFNRANYVRDRVLNREEIGNLCTTLFNLTEFSVTRANEAVFLSSTASSSCLKVIWTEKDGKREIVNRTKEEIEAENRVKASEESLRLRQRKKKRKRKGETTDEKIDLFS